MKFLWTAIYVKNLDQSIAFYSELVGLKLLKRFPAGPALEIAFMGNATTNETLVELLADKNNPTVSFGESVSMGFAVDSLDATIETVKGKNVSIYRGPMETPTSRFFYIKDPNGMIVQFFQPKK